MGSWAAPPKRHPLSKTRAPTPLKRGRRGAESTAPPTPHHSRAPSEGPSTPEKRLRAPPTLRSLEQRNPSGQKGRNRRSKENTRRALVQETGGGSEQQSDLRCPPQNALSGQKSCASGNHGVLHAFSKAAACKWSAQSHPSLFSLSASSLHKRSFPPGSVGQCPHCSLSVRPCASSERPLGVPHPLLFGQRV